MLLLADVFAVCAIWAGMILIISKTVLRMPNKVSRFVVLFVLGVPLKVVINYVDVRLLGYHQIGWTAASTIDLLFATGYIKII